MLLHDGLEFQKNKPKRKNLNEAPFMGTIRNNPNENDPH